MTATTTRRSAPRITHVLTVDATDLRQQTSPADPHLVLESSAPGSASTVLVNPSDALPDRVELRSGDRVVRAWSHSDGNDYRPAGDPDSRGYVSSEPR